MGLTNIEQKVKGGEESICTTCAHNKVCRYMDNQPCVECSQYAGPEQHGRWSKFYKSGNKVEAGWVSSCCDRWNNRQSNFCPTCGKRMDREMVKNIAAYFRVATEEQADIFFGREKNTENSEK